MMPQNEGSSEMHEQASPAYGRYEGNQTSSAHHHDERIGRVVENLDAVGVEDPGEAEIGSQLVEWGGNQDDTL
ncbi:MAG: hypothetical protein E6J11_07920 [Chloroflexi bacterium]|nr:MAG: hypothetical protein E6J11_07920 [Chloroflexota bacterium]